MNGQNNAKIRFVHSDMMSFEFFQQNINLDDIYIGQPKPDLSIEHTYTINTNSSLVTDTLYYRLFNGGAGSSSNSTTEFYWSTDSLLDASDLFLGSIAEPSIPSLGFLNQKFVFSKPTTSNGNYFIIYKVDVTGAINEMWESNNLGYYRLKQESIYSVPYFNDFETQANGWWHNSTIGLDSWKLGTPTGTILNTAFSGTSAFSTTQLSPLPKMSRAHLYSPIFDFTTIADPVLEMDMKLHYRTKYTFESQMNLSYSIDGGATWKVLDTTSSSFNRWYYPMTFNTWAGIDVEYYNGNVSHLLFSGAEKAFPSTYEYNSRDVDGNTRYNVDIAFLAGKPHVQFRFNIGSAKNDSTLITGYSDLEGAIMDNFSINGRVVDLFVPYKKHLMISSNKQKIGFSMYIKNSGNYISYTTTNKFYVSTDTILDASDFYLGEDTMKGIRPEFKRYINKTFNSPANLSNYNYLIYQLDVPNFNAEKNENNNVGYWPLSLDSIKTLPYLMDFNDTIVNGWYEFLTGPFTGNLIQDQWRFRNIRGIMEPLNTPQRQTGTMFTEAINNNIHVSQVPFWYLESPVFNFSNYNNLQLSFKLFVYASAVSGGNLEYSLNG
ncbi:MAG TPA: CARDB domain-containing protein, partial [Bacteroidia bacterium]|nr:CARDB domain-containing protein [Bacteroidia bacterium]